MLLPYVSNCSLETEKTETKYKCFSDYIIAVWAKYFYKLLFVKKYFGTCNNKK